MPPLPQLPLAENQKSENQKMVSYRGSLNNNNSNQNSRREKQKSLANRASEDHIQVDSERSGRSKRVTSASFNTMTTRPVKNTNQEKQHNVNLTTRVVVPPINKTHSSGNLATGNSF